MAPNAAIAGHLKRSPSAEGMKNAPFHMLFSSLLALAELFEANG